jgi:molybdate transport repressor ModE-like protein
LHHCKQEVPIVDWSDLKLLLALLDQGSLKGAARVMNLDYTTVWRHVQRLEATLGKRIFVRLRGQVRPTPVGLELAARAQEIERLLISAGAVGTGSREAVGELRVATADMLLGPIVLPVMRRLRNDAPRLRISLEVSPLTSNVAKLEVDVAIRLGEALSGESVVQVALGEIGFGAYAAPDVAAEYRGRDVNTWPLLTIAARWSKFTTSRWQAANAPQARSAGEFDTMMSMAEATEAGLGIGLLPHSVAVRSGRLVGLPLRPPVASVPLTLAFHVDMRDDGRIRALVRAAQLEAAERKNLLLGGSATPVRAPLR